MLHFSRTLALAAAAALVVAGSAHAQAKQNFNLTNDTGYVISEVYVSPTAVADWQEDVLGQDVLGDQENVDINFDRSETSCKWDIKVVYDDGESAEWDGFNLCTISDITLDYDRDTGKTWATSE